MRKMRRTKQEGYALLTAMGVGVVVLSMTAAVMLRMSSSTRQIVQREKLDGAETISESVLNHVLDAMAEITASGTDDDAGIYKTATQIASELQATGSDFLNTSVNSPSNYTTSGDTPILFTRVTGTANLPVGSNNYAKHSYASDGRAYDPSVAPGSTFWQTLNTGTTHSATFWNAFKNDSTTNALTNTTIGGVAISDLLEGLHHQAYAVYHVKKGSLEADSEISIAPLATDIDGTSDNVLHDPATFKAHNDVYRIRVITYVPNIKNPTSYNRVEVTINRPVKRKDSREFAFKQAVLAGGTVNLQNFNTSSGPCAAGSAGASCIDYTTGGDVHSNTSISIGPNGHVQGKVTSSGTVDVNGTQLPATTYQNGIASDPRDSSGVTSRVDNSHDSQSLVDQIPLPDFDTSTTSVDSTPCVNTGTANDEIYENCVYSGNLSNTHGKTVTFKGTVHITGSTDIKGSQRCGSTDPCKVVIDGTASVGGNGSSTFNSTAETLYVVKGTGASPGDTCLDVGGTPDASGQYGSLFFVDNPDCNTAVRGASQFFGGIITKGTVGTVGNASQYGIQRDSDMTALLNFIKPEPLPKNELFPAVIAWKNLR